ncbi:MAG: hydrogenase formation protein HypD [Lachnospira sp.]
MTSAEIIKYLKEYDGKEIRLMEVCGSHTAAIEKYGIRNILSDKIGLISGPGCPVCVTPTAYIDRLIELAMKPDTTVVTFADMLRVPGSIKSLNEAKGEGASVEFVYSPVQFNRMAKEHPEKTFVFAAVGFETTAPVYTMILDEAVKNKIENIRLLTAIKTMPAVLTWLLENQAGVDGYLAPGHVCAITGSEYFKEISDKYKVPMAVSGFTDEELLFAIYGLVEMVQKGSFQVKNYYPSVVDLKGNVKAKEKLSQYFEVCDASWRGMGVVEKSGLKLKKEYEHFDAGSDSLTSDNMKNHLCKCGQILMGKATPEECPIFSKVCNPGNPQGACMVSYEGSCYQRYINN